MSTTNQQRPANPSFLSPIGFVFKIARLPTVNFFVQSVSIPSITTTFVEVKNPFNKITRPSNLLYEDFEITFKVDEDFKNYLELHDWMVGIGFPDEFQQYAAIAENPTGYGELSDSTLTILTSAKNPNIEVLYKDTFPTSLSEIKFDASMEDIDYLTATATFRCLKFEIRTIV